MDGEKLPYQKTFLAKLISTSGIEERERKKEISKVFKDTMKRVIIYKEKKIYVSCRFRSSADTNSSHLFIEISNGTNRLQAFFGKSPKQKTTSQQYFPN